MDKFIHILLRDGRKSAHYLCQIFQFLALSQQMLTLWKQVVLLV
jgi:hypothetical protein